MGLRLKINFGFSLLELLIATALGFLLVGIVLQIYLSVKKTYSRQNEIVRLSENIRFATYFLRQNIMHAGFVGCRRAEDLDLIDHTNIDFSVVRGYTSPQVPSFLQGKVAPNTDVIVIAKANADITAVTADVNVGATTIKVNYDSATSDGLLMLISDCKNADLFVAKNNGSKTIRSGHELAHSYRVVESLGNVLVAKFEEIAFFISKTSRMNSKKEVVHSLYFVVNRGKKMELVSEVVDMQIKYGVDELGQGKVGRYLRAAEIDSLKLWDKVLSVEIALKPQNQGLIDDWKVYIKLQEKLV